MTSPVYVMMSVDTEEEWDWSGPYPVAGTSVANIQGLPRFQSICERYGLRPTYFTNYAVIADPGARETMQLLASRNGVEVGMHVHPWNTPPITKLRDITSLDTYLHNASPDVVASKLGATYDALVRAGIVPVSFRGGRYSSSTQIQEFLRQRRFVADCSVVPYTTWNEDGAPDYRHRDLMPTRLAPRSPDECALWELPLTMGYSRQPFATWAKVFGRLESRPLNSLRVVGILGKLGVIKRVWLNFEVEGQSDWIPFLKLVQSAGVPCVTLTVHSSSLSAGPGPYTRTPHDEDRILQRIERLFSTLNRLPGFLPATAREVALGLEDQHLRSHTLAQSAVRLAPKVSGEAIDDNSRIGQ